MEGGLCKYGGKLQKQSLFKVLFFPDLSASHSFQLYPGPRSAYSLPEKHLIWKKMSVP